MMPLVNAADRFQFYGFLLRLSPYLNHNDKLTLSECSRSLWEAIYSSPIWGDFNIDFRFWKVYKASNSNNNHDSSNNNYFPMKQDQVNILIYIGVFCRFWIENSSLPASTQKNSFNVFAQQIGSVDQTVKQSVKKLFCLYSWLHKSLLAIQPKTIRLNLWAGDQDSPSAQNQFFQLIAPFFMFGFPLASVAQLIVTPSVADSENTLLALASRLPCVTSLTLANREPKFGTLGLLLQYLPSVVSVSLIADDIPDEGHGLWDEKTWSQMGSTQSIRKKAMRNIMEERELQLLRRVKGLAKSLVVCQGQSLSDRLRQCQVETLNYVERLVPFHQRDIRVLNIQPYTLDFRTMNRLVDRCHLTLIELSLDLERCDPALIIPIMHKAKILQSLRLFHLENFTPEDLQLLGQTLKWNATDKTIRQLHISKCYQGPIDTLIQQVVTPALTDLSLTQCQYVSDDVLLAIGQKCHELSRLTLTWCKQVKGTSLQRIMSNCPMISYLDLTGIQQLKDQIFTDYYRLIGSVNLPLYKQLQLRYLRETNSYQTQRRHDKESPQLKAADNERRLFKQSQIEPTTLVHLVSLNCTNCNHITTDLLITIGAYTQASSVKDYYGDEIGLFKEPNELD